ncbi:DUF4145 domain-containing protein [Mesorhizobium sangaii]|uniref:DUF4145 domain-containing protein n=1 Tax=Mesorhizobium sangaii TaxID=505389 RepID=A0A841PKV7_9HYPH|nr:DUF4145 domain-containing protein [Mesorhizobium sangaii]MBB6414243.1 hypothetical protein [Mesorhizobium sangaii]
MGFLIRDCVRCGVKSVQMIARGFVQYDGLNSEIFMVCQSCIRGSIYHGQPQSNPVEERGALDAQRSYHHDPIIVEFAAPTISTSVPDRVADLFREAAISRRAHRYEAAGAIFRKTIDVASKHLYATDERLKDRKPADALRSRLKALGELKILDEEIVELADVAALDGNDAVHDVDPYTAAEAEALEDLTADLLDRLFVRPAKLAAVKAKQIAAGQRKS